MTADEILTLGPSPKKKSSARGRKRSKTPADVRVEKISGAFSTESTAQVGTGATQRKVMQKAYWFAEEGEPDKDGTRVILVQPLNSNNVPTGNKEPVLLPEFLSRFSAEIEFYQTEVFPRMIELKETIVRAEGQRDQGAFYSAQFEYESALGIDLHNVRANFGLGLTYLSRGETAKAEDIFKRLVALDAAFAPEHKHLFNEFGISLRKSGLTTQAVEYYSRALDITEDDENLFYNIARAYCERGDEAECRENLQRALDLDPNMDVALRFMAFLDGKAG
ncbi:tetratricopeptide repeat protein [uncultured Pseudodesulfovibrio sp.]|uniref:tetratricopeptide repeat protein n=1 Tax=uncultured Pseudodesulfovibrio sp. TaxID=2035858 RepID=UPI0029C7E94E|nr:tetratricopeptide repeat protein [uncultured Pseudodesulfovibrio sp.]